MAEPVVMGNGYLDRDQNPWVDIFENPKEQPVKSMDDIVPVNVNNPDYPVNVHLYKLKASFGDILDGCWEELKEHRDTILNFRQGYYQRVDRFIIVYPSGDNHRVKNVQPSRYVSVKNYNDPTFETGLTTMLHPPTGTWMYLHKEKEIAPNISELVERIVKEVVDDEGEDRDNYNVEMALSFKGPGCLLNRHCDHDDNNAYYRYHAVLKTHDHNYMVTGNTPEDDYIIVPDEGEIWGFGVVAPHWAGNDSQRDDEFSWHLIIDVIPKETYQTGDRKIK